MNWIMSFEILVIFHVNYVADKLSLPSEWVASRPNSSEYIYIYIYIPRSWRRNI